MLTTNDIVVLFEAMRTAYGQQWKHGESAISLWRQTLARFDSDQIVAAQVKAMTIHINFPPTLPQFMAILQPRVQANTYSRPPAMPRTLSVANLAMLKAMVRIGGVDKLQVRQMEGIKNAMVEDHGENKITADFVDELEHEFNSSAKLHDSEMKQDETQVAAERFRVKHGIHCRAV